MYKNLTASGANQVFTGRANKVKIQVNGALTGTITVTDALASGASVAVAVVTNPTVGSVYEYWDFVTGVRVNPSATCDITVNVDTGRTLK